jgi:hypothetical protein
LRQYIRFGGIPVADERVMGLLLTKVAYFNRVIADEEQRLFVKQDSNLA